MAILHIDDILAGFSDSKKQRLEFIFREPLKQGEDVFGPESLIVSVDATTTEAYKLTANITQNPIETGSTLSDHIHIRPQTLTIDGIMTDKPIEILPALAQVPVRAFLSSTARGLLGPILGGYEKHLAIAGTGLINEKIIAPLLGTRATRRDIARLYWNYVLKARFEAKQLFAIRSEVGIIENCFFNSITWNRQRKHGDALFFQAVIQEVQTVTSDVRILPRAKESQKTANRGIISPKTIEQGTPNEPQTRTATQIKAASRANKHTYSKPNYPSSGLADASKKTFNRFKGLYSRATSFITGG